MTVGTRNLSFPHGKGGGGATLSAWGWSKETKNFRNRSSVWSLSTRLFACPQPCTTVRRQETAFRLLGRDVNPEPGGASSRLPHFTHTLLGSHLQVLALLSLRPTYRPTGSTANGVGSSCLSPWRDAGSVAGGRTIREAGGSFRQTSRRSAECPLHNAGLGFLC